MFRSQRKEKKKGKSYLQLKEREWGGGRRVRDRVRRDGTTEKAEEDEDEVGEDGEAEKIQIN